MMKRTFYALLASFTLSATVSSAYSQSVPALCNNATRECLITIASSYLKALTSHDPSNVPFADNVQRWENGVNTASGAENIREGLRNDSGYKLIQGLREIHWLVDGNQVIAYYLIDTALPYAQFHFGTTHITERFQIDKGKITQIEAIFCTSVGSTQEADKLPPNSLSIFCSRL